DVNAAYVASTADPLPVRLLFKFNIQESGRSRKISWVAMRESGVVTEADFAAWNSTLDRVGAHLRHRVAMVGVAP
ncbi:MAG: hypothetical protein KJ579_01415, partial [Verrucomicrobia bacterium]|nr:hypothetical protein [Verrucomicrobiota bacterium]